MVPHTCKQQSLYPYDRMYSVGHAQCMLARSARCDEYSFKKRRKGHETRLTNKRVDTLNTVDDLVDDIPSCLNYNHLHRVLNDHMQRQKQPSSIRTFSKLQKHYLKHQLIHSGHQHKCSTDRILFADSEAPPKYHRIKC